MKIVKNKLNSSKTNKLEIEMWEILTNLVDYEMNTFESSLDDSFWSNNYIVKDLLNKMLEKILNGKQFPYSYLFMFRNNILDKERNEINDVGYSSIYIKCIM